MIPKRMLINWTLLMTLGGSLFAGSETWALAWKGRGFPPPVMVNGYSMDGGHLPIEFEFKFDVSTRSAIEYNEAGDKLHPDIRKWYVDKAISGYKHKGNSGCIWFKIKTDDLGNIKLFKKRN